MKIIRIRPNEKLANSLRGVGLTRVVDSPRVRRLLGIPVRATPRPIGPKVSVIIPAYNVAGYLEDAVDSVQRQTYPNLEILIVNDGSQDDSGEIADRIAASDKRVRVIHKANGGLGAARNTGLSNTSGKYVTFVDSDDQLPPRAIETLLASLERTGSDFAIGAMERFNSTRVWIPEWVTEVHDIKREAIQAHDHPPILWDVFACNKLFRRSVWDARVGFFPEGVLYEDQECTAKLYVQGAVFDSLADIVYRWRFRDDGTSITQNKQSEEDLKQRLLVARTVQEVLHDSPHDHLIDTWYAKLLGDDLFWYYREVPRANDQFWEVLKAGVKEFYVDASPVAIAEIQFDRRLQMLAIERGSRADFEKLLYFFQENGSHWQTQIEGKGNVSGRVSILDELEMSFSADELQVQLPDAPLAVLSQHVNEADGSIKLLGYVIIPNLEPSSSRKLTASLTQRPRSPEDDTPKPQRAASLNLLQIAPRVDLAAQTAIRDPFNDHSSAGFELTLPAELTERLIDGADRDWELSLTVEEAGHTWRTSSFGGVHSGHFARSLTGEITDQGERLRLSPNNGRLEVSASKPAFVVESASIQRNSVLVSFTSNAKAEHEAGLQVFATYGDAQLALTKARHLGDQRWGAQLDLPELAPDSLQNYQSIELSVEHGGGMVDPLDISCASPRKLSEGEFGICASEEGTLSIERYTQFGEANSAELLDGGRVLRMRGITRLSRRQVRQPVPSFILWSPDHTIYAEKTEHIASTGEYTSEFNLKRADVDGAMVGIPLGTYTFGMLLATGTKLPASFTLLAGEQLARSFPRELQEGTTRIVLGRRPHDGGLQLQFAAPYEPNERGVLAQDRMANVAFGVLRSTQVRPAVLFESFGGRGISDSPKALDAVLAANRPDIERFWTVRDHTVAVPAGATPVLMYSQAWYEALATSQLLVNNNNFPTSFRKTKGQTYVQTWHGTPLKRVGNDVPAANLSLSYRKLMQREAEEYWDVLLAQGPWAGETLARAFGYTGQVLDQGYPRNDALLAPAAEDRREGVRRHFGISQDQLVVLYAPTWRDNSKAANGKYLQPEHLRHQDVFEAFGFGAVMLLRGHVNNAGSGDAKKGRTLIDVSSHPDINDLFLAADVLVTDYSSAQFDFINTGKPVIYLAPDLDAYRDTVRGFYFDWEAIAPGPIVSTSAEVVELLKELGGMNANYLDRYKSFRERFAGADDGFAATRVIDALSGSGRL